MPETYNGLAHTSGATFFFIDRVYPLKTSDGRLFIWLAHDTKDARAVFDNLRSWHSPEEVHYVDPAETESMSSLVCLAEGRHGIYVVLSEHYELLLGLVESINKDKVPIKKGQFESPLTLSKKLSDIGYERNGEGPGSFVVRGDTISVDTIGDDEPLKILLEYDKIEALKHGHELLEEIIVYPAQPTYQAGKRKDIRRLVTTNAEVHQHLLPAVTGDIISLNFLKGPDRKVFKKPQAFTKKSLSRFVQYATKHKTQGYKLYVQAIDAETLRAVFEQFDTSLAGSLFYVDQYPEQESFISEELKVIFWTQRDIFGADYLKPQKVEKKELDFLSTLEDGGYVTHTDHGIGIYRGIVETQIDGYTRENVLIEYKKGDKLYVPIEQLHKVDKYVGGAKPTVNRLSGAYWNRTRRSVSKDVKQLARELVSIYARRSISYVTPLTGNPKKEAAFAKDFPYKETSDQKECIATIDRLLERDTPMDALVVGDVGFGKTEVAMRAAYKAVLNEKQVVLLAPTTILAQQHYDNLTKRFENTEVRIGMLSRFTKKLKGLAEEKQTILALADGTIDIIVSTHRIFSKDIRFKNLGMVVIDEEQRFGVKHKESLKKLKKNTHVLTLSATPIPRTLYFSLSGIREMCRIDTPPPGRKAVTNVIEPMSKDIVKKAITYELKRNGQVYYLHNRVETIDTAAQSLKKLLGKKVHVGILHGQMDEEDIASVMHSFDIGEIDVLVCSTIIENGLDLPNVNTLIVTDAQKLGLGQLYQLRGRVGRSDRQAHAYFLYNPAKVTPTGVKRLEALEDAEELASGYKLANRDLEIRGAGNLLGKSQHGHVKSVGLSVYTQMLDQAVSIYLGDTSKEKLARDIRMEIPMTYEIPHYIEESSKKRLRMYRELALLNSTTDVTAYFGKHFKGVRDEAIENLQLFVNIRIKALEAGVEEIKYTRVDDERMGKYIFVYVTYSVAVPKKLSRWSRVSSNTIRFRASDDDDVLHALRSLFGV